MLAPLPIRHGLNPSRIKAPRDITALDFVTHLIDTQLYKHPDDNASGVLARFKAQEVVDDFGKPFAPQDIIPEGKFLWFYRKPVEEQEIPGTLDIIYQDDNIVVVNKPAFLATMPRGKHITQSAVVKLRQALGISSLVPAHRLDRHTSGLLLFTTHQKVRASYQKLFEKRKVTKVYAGVTALPGGICGLSEPPHEFFLPQHAFHHGSPEGFYPAPTAQCPWILEHHLLKIQGRLATKVLDDTPNSSTAITDVKLIDSYPGVLGPALQWQLEPHSGKTHQLRVHMRLLGMPLANDPMYREISHEALWGRTDDIPDPQFVENEDFTTPMGLVAQELHFKDPLSGAPRDFYLPDMH